MLLLLLTLFVNKYHRFAQRMEQLVLLSQDVQLQLNKQVAFWELMEIVDGYQLLELLMPNALYLHIVLQLKELLLHNAYFGDPIAFQTELLALLRQHAHHILLRLVVQMQEQMEYATMLLLQVQKLQEFADYNNVLMQLLKQPQVYPLTLDVSHILLQHLVQHQVLDVFLYLNVDHIQSKLDVFKELMAYAFGQYQKQLLQQQLQLQQQVFAELKNALIN